MHEQENSIYEHSDVLTTDRSMYLSNKRLCTRNNIMCMICKYNVETRNTAVYEVESVYEYVIDHAGP